MDMKEAEIRKAFIGLDVVYIYHNTIDARGDNVSTEREVFLATELAFNEIIALINKLVNRVSAASIVITADHGYLYKRNAMEESDKISKVKLDDGEDNRRFILTSNTNEVEGTVAFSMDYLIGDSRSENPLERTYREKFVLKSMDYDKTKQYFLVMKDDEDPNGMYERIPYTIDIAMIDEFKV